LSISGELLVHGTPDKHVVLRGRRGGAEAWAGIYLDHTDNTRFDYADIQGAKTGITMVKSQCTLQSCRLSHNHVGLLLGCGSATSHATLDDCVIAFNGSDGIFLDASGAEIRDCTITYNGGWGIRGVYYASPKLHRTVVTLNKDGIYCKDYDCNVSADRSVLSGNAGIDIKNESSSEWDLQGNFWGKELTRVLRARGPTVALPNIIGRVRLDGFLDGVPKECGASVRTLDKRRLW
jgi:hypothetical protein